MATSFGPQPGVPEPGVSRTFIDFGDTTVWPGPDGVVKRHDTLIRYDVDSVDPADLLAEIDEISLYEAKLAAIKATRLAAYERRRVHRPAFRSAGTALAHRQRRSVRSAGRDFSTAAGLVALPAVLDALGRGALGPDHVQAILRLHRRYELQEFVSRDQDWMVQIAGTDSWPDFITKLEAWAEVVDPTDPHDADPAHDQRRLLMGKGIAGAAFAELFTTTLCLEQIQKVLTPIYDRLEAEEWADARARLGDAATVADLPRRPSARWHDALMIALRSGGTGHDPGVRLEVLIVVDLLTLMLAAQQLSDREGIVFHPPRADAQVDELHPERADWSAEIHRVEAVDGRHGASYRCHTEHGHQLAPMFALWCTLASDIRRVTLGLHDDGTATSNAGRLFSRKQRTGMRVRDCHCRGPGCGTSAWRTEADHVRPNAAGGETSTNNGQSLCGPCHRHKTWLQSIGMLDSLGHLWDFHHSVN